MPSDRETAATAALSKNKKCRGRMPDGRPNPIDIHVGKRIRLRRLALNLSQETLAELLGITFQQIQNTKTAAIASVLPACGTVPVFLMCRCSSFSGYGC